MEDKLQAAILDELRRQSQEPGGPKVGPSDDKVTVDGAIDVDALVMVVVGAMAGGP